MPFYIFFRGKGSERWELIEAIDGQSVARQTLDGYYILLKKRTDIEVMMVEADMVTKAREMLEFGPSDEAN